MVIPLAIRGGARGLVPSVVVAAADAGGNAFEERSSVAHRSGLVTTSCWSAMHSASLSAGRHTIQVYSSGTATGGKSAVALDYVTVG